MLSVFRRPPDPAAASAWFAGSSGKALLDSEAACVRAALQQFPRQRSLWLGPAAARLVTAEAQAPSLCLHPVVAPALAGDLRCGLPLPLASECCAIVIVQHALEMTAEPELLLEECARVLIPGGWLWLLALNPLAPFRWRWSGHGLRGREPMTWRRRLRAVGLQPEPVSQGLGAGWRTGSEIHPHPGVGLRPAFLLRCEKRTLPLTPIRKPRAIGLQAGTPA